MALLVNCDSWRSLWIRYVVLALIPALGEELLFRGVLQTILHRMTKNKHVAIWSTAFLFALMHLQLLTGFYNKLIGGVFLGYLYAWSGNLAFPILAHCLNNTLAVSAVFYDQRLLASDTELVMLNAWWLKVTTVGSMGILMYYFKKLVQSPSISTQK